MQDLLLTLYSSAHTVFQIEEIAQLFPDTNLNNLRRRLHYFVQVGKLRNPRRGVYAKNDYHPLELANKIFVPSYISLETVLFQEGVIFQYDQTISVAAYLSRNITVDGHHIHYKALREPALSNQSGIEEKTGFFVAGKERAFLDAIFLYKNYYFDYLGGLNWEQVDTLLPLYESAALGKRVAAQYKEYKKDYGIQ